MADLSQKIRRAESALANSRGGGSFGSGGGRGSAGGGGDKPGSKDGQLDKVVRDSNKIANEEITGLLSTIVKERIFNFSGLKLGQCGHLHQPPALNA